MRFGNSLSVASHIANLLILIYFISFLIEIKQISSIDLFISFFGLFISLIANILSVIER